ncbi:TRAP transporter small permease [uncultured Lentibacter sp.]|uniref:TRAP transporter small permease n=1 Tax=uncultured Lentibacter sp. TaxID=1659309 RepID=UPI0026055808|nr:TRAP transporter small permease [uncultured Lentibacter sp.]
MATRKPSFTDQIEELLIATILGAMTLITFAGVVIRYVFDTPGAKPVVEALGLPTNLLWGLEATVFLFAWLVLLGASYAVKTHSHLGVDAIVNMLSAPARRVLALISVTLCLFFSMLMVKAAYDYWAVFADLPPTSGRWVPTGFDSSVRSQSFYEVQDVPMLGMFRFLEDLINYGDAYEKMPKVVPYIVLPISMVLLLVRFAQVAVLIWRGEADRLVASHEVEEELEEVRAQQNAQDVRGDI